MHTKVSKSQELLRATRSSLNSCGFLAEVTRISPLLALYHWAVLRMCYHYQYTLTVPSSSTNAFATNQYTNQSRVFSGTDLTVTTKPFAHY